MKIFIDSAKLEEIEQAYCCGVVDGVTTNPSLIKKAIGDIKKSGKNIDMASYIKKILQVAKKTPVSLEVTEISQKGMVAQAKRLFKLFNPVANNVVIKIPVNPSFDDRPSMDGINAIKELSKARISVNCTLIFTPEQALLAAKAGARFVSPFAGRIDDYIREQNHIHFEKNAYFPAYGWREDHHAFEDNGIISGVDLVKQTVDIFKKHNIKAKVLAASIRNARQARECALVGADIATLPASVIQELLVHYKSQQGMKRFVKDIVPEYSGLIR